MQQTTGARSWLDQRLDKVSLQFACLMAGNEAGGGGKLDFFSEEFDPLLALQTPGLLPPRPQIRPLNNVGECKKLLPGEFEKHLKARAEAEKEGKTPSNKPGPASRATGVEAAKAAAAPPTAADSVRPAGSSSSGSSSIASSSSPSASVQPSSVEEQPRAKRVREADAPDAKSYILRLAGTMLLCHVAVMLKCALADRKTIVEGPMSTLRDAFHQRKRVRVFIRSAASVRGHCTGFIVAFDKHWNLVR